MRVIGGVARGRPLKTPPGTGTRPTSDRVREALFSSVAGVVGGAQVLDLWAGSGALGIEALSRGARHAVFVERDPKVMRVLTGNLAALGFESRATVRRDDALRFATAPSGGPFSLVLCDPPYAEPLPAIVKVLGALHAAEALAPAATIVVEREKRDATLDAELPGFLVEDRRRTYGDTLLLYLRATEESAE